MGKRKSEEFISEWFSIRYKEKTVVKNCLLKRFIGNRGEKSKKRSNLLIINRNCPLYELCYYLSKKHSERGAVTCFFCPVRGGISDDVAKAIEDASPEFEGKDIRLIRKIVRSKEDPRPKWSKREKTVKVYAGKTHLFFLLFNESRYPLGEITFAEARDKARKIEKENSTASVKLFKIYSDGRKKEINFTKKTRPKRKREICNDKC